MRSPWIDQNQLSSLDGAHLLPVARCALLLALLFSACTPHAEEAFQHRVLPMLEQRCFSTACHGIGPEQSTPTSSGFYVRVDSDGRVVDVEEARRAALERVTTLAPRTSTLLRVPMPAWAGGGPHAGGATYSGPEDPAVLDLLNWISLEEEGGQDIELTPLQAQFASEVVPVLLERCARSGCHGPRDVAFTAFPLHPDPRTGAINPSEIPAAHRSARRHLDLWSADPAHSRLIRKSIGATLGGLEHRGNRSTLFPEAPADDPLDTPGIEAMLSWARAEREALGVQEGLQPTHLIWVQGPPASRLPYRIAPGPLGSDLWIARWPQLDDARNLSAGLHIGREVEIRDPALSHDASRVAFSMRAEGETNFALYELELSSTSLRRVTAGPGSYVEPVHSVDGRWIASWDGHREFAADGSGIAPELVAVDSDGSLERLTYTPVAEVSPSFLATGKTRGELVFGSRRSGELGPEGLLFRFPLCHDGDLHGEPEYHVQHGASSSPWALREARDLPSGRQLMIALPDVEQDDDRGALLVLDRSMGPALREGQVSSLGGVRSPLTWIDRDPRYRDPAVLPDGRAIVVRDDALVTLTLGPTPAFEPLLAVEHAALRSPLPVFPRPDEDDGHEMTTTADGPWGFLALRDVAILETLFGRTEPSGLRELRADLHSIRLLVALGLTVDEIEHRGDSTTVGASSRIPARMLAEVPLAADRSQWLQVPARVPILLQLIDARGMIVGRQLDRWYYAGGDETVPGGTNTETYRSACAGCHGAMSGLPADAAAATPDALSSASITLSTHRMRDRRRPLAPTRLEGPGERIDYITTIAPLIEACAQCHDASASLPLSAETAYGALMPFIDMQTLRARRSPLIETLLGEELDAPGSPRACPPSEEALVRLFSRWIEVGAFEDLSRRRR